MPHRNTFDPDTSKRLAIESASGIAFMHSLSSPYMHRDVKSLNVFLDEHMVLKVNSRVSTGFELCA